MQEAQIVLKLFQYKQNIYQFKCQNLCCHDSLTSRTLWGLYWFFCSSKLYNYFQCSLLKLIGKMIHFILVITLQNHLTLTIYIQRLNPLFFIVKLYDSALLCVQVNFSLKSLTLAANDRQDYAHIAFGNDSAIFLHEINENSNFYVYIGLSLLTFLTK